MLIKLRSWSYFFFMLTFAFLGIAEATVVTDSIMLFQRIPIPSLTKYVLPLITIAIFIFWGAWVLWRIGLASDAENEEQLDVAQEILLKILLESPTVCTIISIMAMYLLANMQTSLISWKHALDVYSYGVLWIALGPCFLFLLEFIQGIKGFKNISDNNNNYLKKSQTIDGLVSIILGLIHFYLLITTGNMSITPYTYILFTCIVVFRIIRFNHAKAVLWTENVDIEINEIDQKEGIL